MKRQILFIVLLTLAFSAFSQVKIGYANLEFILRNMPEAQQMNKEVDAYRKTLEEQVGAKQEYYQTLVNDYNTKQKSGYAESLLKSMRQEIANLEREIQVDINNADLKMAAFSNKKLEPITQKITEAVNAVYAEGKYTYIFNSADGTGNSIVLKGPEADNLTYRILEKLGVKIEEE